MTCDTWPPRGISSPVQLRGPVPYAAGVGRSVQVLLLDPHRGGPLTVFGAVLAGPGPLVPAEPVGAEGDQFGGRQRLRTLLVPQQDVNLDLLAEQVARYRDRGYLEHGRMGAEHGLDLSGCDVLARPPDHVLDPAREVQVARGVAAPEVTRVAPAVPEGRGRLGRLVEVPAHQAGRPHRDLPRLPIGGLGAVRVEDPHVRAGAGHADGAGADHPRRLLDRR